MSSTEAAASLFGSEDPASNPFATLGTEFSGDTPEDLFPGSTGTPSQSTNVFDTVGDQHSPNTESQDTVHGQQPAAQSYGLTTDSYASSYNTTVTQGTYGTYGEVSQWNSNHANYNMNSPNTLAYNDTNKYAPPPQQDLYAPPIRSDPYAPPPAPSYVPQAAQSSHSYAQPTYSTTYNASESNPYSPSATGTQPPYASYSTYGSTEGSTNAYNTPYAVAQVPSYPAAPPSVQASLATVPPPPAPTTTHVTRPKVSNAYDPPFPTTSYSRRNVSGPARVGAGYSVPAQATYAAYKPTTPPPLRRTPPVSSGYTSPPPLNRTPAFDPTNQQPAISQTAPPHLQHPSVPPPQLQRNWANQYGVTSQGSQPHEPNEHHVYDTTPSQITSNATIPLVETSPHTQWTSGDVKHSSVDEPESNFFDEILESENHSVGAEPSDQIVSNHPENQYIPSLSPSQPKISSPKTNPTYSPIINSQNIDCSTSPRHSPRPPSTAAPVYGLSHPPPRLSPELRREVIEHVSRARTTSPGINNTPHTSLYGYPTGNLARPKSASVHSLDKMSSAEVQFSSDRYAPKGVNRVNGSTTEAAAIVASSDSRRNMKPHHLYSSHSSYLPTPLTQEPSAIVGNPYAPSQTNRLNQTHSVNAYGVEFVAPQEPKPMVVSTITPYAPSPSLMGANDPLGRTSVHVPVFSFGFGGKMVTCFHDADKLHTGFDVALSSRTSTKVILKSWKNVIPDSALDIATNFPGPLHADPGPPSTSLMKVTSSTQAKTKKTQVVKYLTDRLEEIVQSLGYLNNGSLEKRTAEGKLVLVKLLKIMVENDGKLLGTPQLDAAVRTALVPRLDGLLSTNTSDTASNFTATADAPSLLHDSMSYGALSNTISEAPISVTTLRPAALDKIEEFLLRGERRQAYHYALDEKLWAHAMVIASSIGQEAWKDVVSEFLKTELGGNKADGRDGLRVAYSLYSGQGAAAVQELVPQNLLARTNARLPIPAPTLGQATPRTPNFVVPSVPSAKIPVETLSKWAETVSMLILSPLSNDASATLTAFGDQLLGNGWLEAAHTCYILSPQTSLMGGVGHPAARFVLLGSKNPAAVPTFVRDPDSIIFSEILEYALASVPVPKGQEPSHGLPHLQAYRLLRAYAAAESGDLQTASRYCEAITTSMTRGSSYFTSTMVEKLRGLADRLSGVSHEKGNSWAGKISKPSLDTIGGWLEGRFTKLVTGDADTPPSPKEEPGKSDAPAFTGPFSHYNTISSTTSSARSSPQPSFVTPAYALPQRTESAMSNKAPYGYQIDRSSSAMESIRQKGSPGPTPRSSSAATNSFHPIQTHGEYSNGNAPYSPGSDLQTPKQTHRDAPEEDTTVQEVTWWGAAGYGDTGKTPTAAQFEQVDDGEGMLHMNTDGFFSPMASQSFGIEPSNSKQSQPSYAADNNDDDDDDLGLRNSGNKHKEYPGEEKKEEQKVVAKQETKANNSEPTQQSTGWFGRWWKRSDSSGPGPVKASLGEESAFYYDKELKRWVNKKAGAEEAPKPAPPPPPPRAQTTSPAMLGANRPPGNGAAGNGGPRSSSAIDLSGSPPTNKMLPPRIRSGLAPPGIDSAPPTPTGTRPGAGGPPISRPSSSMASKKTGRIKRYVDVLAQENGA